MRVRSMTLVCSVIALTGLFLTSAAETSAQEKPEGVGGRLLERLRSRRQGEKPGEAPATKTVHHPDKGEEIDIAGLRVSVWQPSGEATGPAPLVVFSHGFHGMSTQSRFLIKALADNGYLVVAPNHNDALRGGTGDFTLRPEVGFGKAGEWTDATYRDRGEDLQALLKALKSDTKWTGKIDWNKVALAGHSLGGYTVLGLAGAWPSWKSNDIKIKAVLALSPYCSPYLKNGNLGGIEVPVMYQGGTKDFGITPFVKRNGGAYDSTPGPAYFVELNEASHFAWTDLKADFQDSIVYYSVAFLNKHVKGDATADPKQKRADVIDLRSK